MTPNQAAAVARILCLCLCIADGLLFTASHAPLPVEMAALMAYAITISALLGWPRIRSTDLFTASAVLLSGLELARGAIQFDLDGGRWLGGIAAIGLVVATIQVHRLRAMAVRNGYMSFAAWRVEQSARRRSDAAVRLDVAPGPAERLPPG